MKRIIILFILLILSLMIPSVMAQKLALPLEMESGYSLNPTTIYPGDSVVLTVFFKNYGTSIDSSAKDTNTELILSKEFTGIKTTDELGTILPENTKTAVLKFKVNENTEPATYKLSLNLNYFVEKKLIKKVYIINLIVSKKNILEIKNIQFNKLVHLKDSFKVSGEVVNAGNSIIRNVNASIKMSSGEFTSLIPKKETNLFIGNIKPKESKKIEFELLAPESIKTGIYSLILNASSTDDSSSDSENISLEVKGKPELVLSAIDYSITGKTNDKKIIQGDQVSLSIQMDNLGKENAKAVKIKLQLPKGISGNNTNYIGTIEKDDSSSALFDLVVKENATANTYTIPIKIYYKDEIDTEQSINSTIQLTIFNKPPESPIIPLTLIIIILIIVYFLLKMILRSIRVKKKRL